MWKLLFIMYPSARINLLTLGKNLQCLVTGKRLWIFMVALCQSDGYLLAKAFVLSYHFLAHKQNCLHQNYDIISKSMHFLRPKHAWFFIVKTEYLLQNFFFANNVIYDFKNFGLFLYFFDMKATICQNVFILASNICQMIVLVKFNINNF